MLQILSLIFFAYGVYRLVQSRKLVGSVTPLVSSGNKLPGWLVMASVVLAGLGLLGMVISMVSTRDILITLNDAVPFTPIFLAFGLFMAIPTQVVVDSQAIYQVFPMGGFIQLCTLSQITQIDQSKADRVTISFDGGKSKPQTIVLSKGMITPEMKNYCDAYNSNQQAQKQA